MQKCPHVLDKHSKIKLLENFFFCRNCGSILCQTKPNKFLATVKPVESESQTEIDPIDLFVNSFKQTPFIKIKKDSIYLEKRARAIKLLEKFNNIYHYTEEIFFLALTYMDLIFKTLYNDNKKITKKQEDLYILNCLFISEKFYEKDSKAPPDFQLYIKNNIYDIDPFDIKEYEVYCLKILKYKLDHHSLYDILKAYMYNGFIFDKEIDFNSIISQIKLAYNYADKLFRDIQYSYIALFFNPDLIAFVIIQLTRKKFFSNKYDKKIKNIYGYKLEDYKECLNEIKNFLDNVQNGLEMSEYHKIPKNSKLD